MTSITEIMSKQPSDFFLGVVELEKTLLIGILDEPMGIELSAVRLAYPIEIAQAWEGHEVSQLVVVPEAGVPEELVIDAGTVAIHNGGSEFGKTYFNNLKDLVRIRPSKFNSKQISRTNLNKQGNPHGAR